MHGRAVGRDMETGFVRGRLEGEAQLGPSGVLIEGEPGIGKSVLFEEVTTSMRGNARVMEAHPVEVETGVSYAALGDLLREVDDHDLMRLPAPQRVAIEVAALRREPLGAVGDIRPVGIALAALWASMAAETRVLVAIDDVGWLDDPTRLALAFAARRVPGVRLRVLLTARPSSAGIVPFPAIETFIVPALATADVRSLVEEHLGIHLDPVRAMRVHRMSQGNPMLALEIARIVDAAADEDEALRDLADHPTIADLARQRIGALPPRTRQVLAIAAALGDPRLDIIEQAVASSATTTRAIRRAREAGVVRVERRRLRFEHPLLAAGASGMLGSDERRALHRRLADIVDDDEARARHLALGHHAPDADVASAVMDGSARASARGAQGAAAELADHALRLTPGHDVAARSQRAVAAATHLTLAGDLTQARVRYEDLLPATPGGPARAAILRAIGEIHLQQDSHPAAIAALEAAAREAAADPVTRGYIGIELAYAYTNQLRIPETATWASRALEDARRAGDTDLLAIALAVHAYGEMIERRGVDLAAVDEALRLERPLPGRPALFRPSLIGGLLLMLAGCSVRATRHLHGVSDDARATGDETSLVSALMYQSWNDILTGDIAMAAAASRESLAVARALGGQAALASALSATSRVAAVRGDLDEVRADVATALALFRGAGWEAGSVWASGSLGMAEWSVGDAAATVEALEGPLGRHHAAGMPVEIEARWGDLAEAYIALRRREDASSIIDRLLYLPHDRPSAPALAVGERARAVLLADEGRLTDALEAIERAATALAAADPNPFEEARTLLVRGLLERRVRRRGAARSSFEGALRIFEGLGASIWAGRSRRELNRLGSRNTGELTETERLVARLAAQGLTNREVGAAAFVTPKSVEGILSRAYAKLGIHSRAELGAWAAARDVEPGAEPGGASAANLVRSGANMR